MSELVSLDFPNVRAHEKEQTNPWDILHAQEYIKAVEAPESAEIKTLRLEIAAKRNHYQTLAERLCEDSEGCLTSDKAFIAHDAYAAKRDPAIGEAYADFTDSQAKLLEAQDKENGNPERSAAEEYINTLNPINYEFSISHEVVAVSAALGQLHDISERKKNREGAVAKIGGWIQDFCDTRNVTNTLKKYGYNPDGPQSGIFDLILQEAKAIRYGVPTKDSRIEGALGRKRIRDYTELNALLSSEDNGANCRRALAGAGYKKYPTDWKDRDFSTCDISKMCAIARDCKK